MFSDIPLHRLSALLGGVAFLVVGNGLYGTLITLRAESEGFGAGIVGALTSAFFAGYMVASLASPRLIERAGLVRSFAVSASVVSMVVLLMAMLVDEAFWLGLRVVHGAAYASAIIVAESWLNAVAEKRNRGRILGIYGSIFLGAWALSQLPVSFLPATSFESFGVVSILFSASLLPLLLSPGAASPDVSATRLPLRRLWRSSPLGVAGCFLTGAAMNSLFGLGPLFIRSLGFGDHVVAAYMAAFFAGGLLAEWPFGLMSDRVDRRWVIGLLSGATATVSLALLLAAGYGVMILVFLGFLLGVFGIPIYSVCVAQANDRVARAQVVGAMSSLLMIYAGGALAGPLIVGLAFETWGPAALFGAIALVNAAILLVAVSRMAVSPGLAAAEKEGFASAPTTTHMASDLDPRGQPSERLGPQARSDAGADPGRGG